MMNEYKASAQQLSDSALRMLVVDLDERAYLFPESRSLTQIKFNLDAEGYVLVELVFAHNVSRVHPYTLRLGRSDAKDLCFRIIDAVYRAQTQHLVTETIRISITVVSNGYIFKIEDQGVQRELYLSTVVIWKVCNALCRIVDLQSPVQSH